jgi:hypothetical protein
MRAQAVIVRAVYKPINPVDPANKYKFMTNREDISRKLIASRIDDLLNKKVSVAEFGSEMIEYMVFRDDKYVYEPGYEPLIEEILANFMDMHDADMKEPGYKLYIPTAEQLIEFRNRLLS